MTFRLCTGLLALALLVAACGGDDATTTTSVPAATSAAPTTTVTTPTTGANTTPPTTAATTTSTAAPAETTTTTSTTVAPGPVLADGRPATFVAITDDYVAVEVDTLTGDIVHIYGQTGTAAEVDAAEEMPPNVLVAIWRSLDGGTVGISDCCEPAAGNIWVLEAGGHLGPNPYLDGAKSHGWTLSPSPVSGAFANVGYTLAIVDPEDPGVASPGAWLDEPSLGFPMGAAAWERDGSALFWTTTIGEVAALATYELGVGEPEHVTLLSWVGLNQDLDGIGSQASGNLVGFLHTRDDSYNIVETEGVVFSADGMLLASFPVETGSTWGGYDPTGTFLVYADADGNVRWQGAGQAGMLADGYIFASW